MARTKEGTTSKVDAVRACLEAGIDNPTAGAAWVRANRGIDLTPNTFSSYKAQIRLPGKRAGRIGTAKSGPRTGPRAGLKRKNGFTAGSSNGGADPNQASMDLTAEVAKTLRPLVAKHREAVLSLVQPVATGLLTGLGIEKF